jgi:hypothetical protein
MTARFGVSLCLTDVFPPLRRSALSPADRRLYCDPVYTFASVGISDN